MGKLLIILLFVALPLLLIGPGFAQPALASRVGSLVSFSLCDTPIAYTIGTIDTAFGVPNEQVTAAATTAAGAWNKAAGKQVFVYNATAPLRINLVFDGRQSLTKKISNLDTSLTTENQVLQKDIAAYEQRAATFKKNLATLNRKIAEANQRGEVTPQEYEQLQAEQASLQQEAQQLNKLAQAVNRTADVYNGQVRELNQTARTLNAALEVKPEEGVYNPLTQTIDIYLYANDNELTHTIMHELGHARGLEHSQNANAIMFSSTNQSITLTADDIQAIQTICQPQNRLTAFITQFAARAKLLSQLYQNNL